MISPVGTYLDLLRAGKLADSLHFPVLIWNAPVGPDEGSTQKHTVRMELTPEAATDVGNALVFELSRFSEQKRTLVIGRSSSCDVQILDDSVSRRHIEIESTRHGWLVADLGSTNGTWVHKAKLAAGAPATLPDGARMQLGNIELFFMLPDSFQTYLAQLNQRP